ncbi:MAG: FG-GAP-like repeat-containing protein [Candidatus Sulfotelmatobacter sp.]
MAQKAMFAIKGQWRTFSDPNRDFPTSPMKVRTAHCLCTTSIAHRTILVVLWGLCLALNGLGGTAQAQNPVPLINLPLVPDAIAPGRSGLTLTVNGTGFVSGSVVKWNGNPLATKFVSSSQLTANVPASEIAKPNTASVTVVSPGTADETSNIVFFPIAVSTPVVTMSAGTEYAVDATPLAVGTADLNGDGKLDLVATNSSDNTVSVLLGNGDGTFQTQTTYAVGVNPTNLAIADFNGDGRPDLAVTNTNSNTISVLLGKGDGTFEKQVQYATGTGPYGIAAADVNGDGKLDLVVTNSSDNTISVLLGKGDGTFQAAVSYAAGEDPLSVTVGDFNRDGKLDLAVANSIDDRFDGDVVTILLGNGDGTFSPPTSYDSNCGNFVTTADFNGDGKLDLAAAGTPGGEGAGVCIFLGNGDGTFQEYVPYFSPALPAWVGAADFNADGKLDLVMSSNSGAPNITASILLGNGNGTFGPFGQYSDYGSQLAQQLAIGDFNGDGKLDVAGAVFGSNAVSVFLQNGFVSLSPLSRNFGVHVLNTNSRTGLVTLTNAGSSTLTIDSIVLNGSNPGDFGEKNNCGKSVPPGGRCFIGVTFTPTNWGPLSAGLTITDSDPSSPETVSLSGYGVYSGPNATISLGSLSFATQLLNTTSPPNSVTLSNHGTATLSITSIMASGDFAETDNCGHMVAPEASCTIDVAFTPKAIGTLRGGLTIADNAPGSPQTVSLSGAGTEVELNPSGLFFRTCTSTSEQEQTQLTNVGTSALSISGIILTGSSAFTQTNNCGSSVKPGGSCTITVTSNGRGTNHTGDVSISDNGGASPQQVSLEGRCAP